MKVFCAVEADKYEFIRYMEKSAKDLAKVLGVKHGSVLSAKARGEKLKGFKIEKVVFDDEGELD